MRPEDIRMRCLEAACEFASGPHEAVAMAGMFSAFVHGSLEVERLDITEDEADALREREEGQHNDH